ncbi:electron transfer flavoprotein subunit beta/FixA family protein [bacterium]|nr:electron transfer flavoprotein subunit beta/FixA family protein [bacterium]
MKRIVVLAKQVPDTANITGDAMKEDGTVNRAALPAVFNPEDLHALEFALSIKDETDAEVVVVSMGPPKAVEILKDALYMGADKVYLVTDRKFAGADTLATSYVLSAVVEKIGNVDLVVAGRQAIDGDTAQVGPQVAEKLGYAQVTYVDSLDAIGDDYLTVSRDAEYETQVIDVKLPALLTVTENANIPRYPSARHMLTYFKSNIASAFEADRVEKAEKMGLVIPVLTLDDLGIDPERCGLKGSPTKVHAIKNIQLTGGDLQLFEANPTSIKSLVHEIMKDYVEV